MWYEEYLIQYCSYCKTAQVFKLACLFDRELRERQQAEGRAQAEVVRLQLALDEHNLELRVKAANEAEAACQQKLTAVEAEIAELRQNIEASYRYRSIRDFVAVLECCELYAQE